MPKIGDTRPDPMLRPATRDEIAGLLRDGLGCRVAQPPRRRKAS